MGKDRLIRLLCAVTRYIPIFWVPPRRVGKPFLLQTMDYFLVLIHKVILKNLGLCRVKVPGPVLRQVVEVRGAGVRAARA